MTVPFIFCASITAISAIISLGFFNSGGIRCDRYSPNHGTLCLCAKHGFGDRERGAIYNGVN
jgi:hypothetical protein